MFGDFEAQRHWLEVTVNLPVSDWYRDTKDNDLQYWGLDYPPLTAYTSWGFGKLAQVVHPDMVALHSSRGSEDVCTVLLMRLSVLLLDTLVFFPAVLWLFGALGDANPKYLLLSLLSPALVLIDHGHFQYNSTCIGLALGAVYLLDCDAFVLGSLLFCLSLNFKQMALYYAPVFFFYLLGRCKDYYYLASPAAAIRLFLKLAATVVGVFAALWVPFCIAPAPGETCSSSLLQVLHRQFPFSRGIFEDKVANMWFALSVAYRKFFAGADMRDSYSTSTLARYSLGLTLLLLAPTVVFLLKPGRKSVRQLTTALVTSALAFFLASFQVHEKSLLLAMVPAALIIDKHNVPFGVWFQVSGLFTMLPLLVKDGLMLPAAACTAIYGVIAAVIYVDIRPIKDRDEPTVVRLDQMMRTGFYRVSYLCMAGLLLAWMLIPTPAALPDLYSVLIALLGAVNLGVAYIYYMYALYVTYTHVPSLVSPVASPAHSHIKCE